MNRTKLEEWICRTEGISALDRETLEALQLKKLNELLKKEKERQGFYKDLPQKLNSLDELSSLPFTTEQELSENSASMLLRSQSEIQRVISGSTSGTTGPAKRLFYTEKDIEHTVGFFAAGISEMVKAGDRVYIGMPFSGPYGLGDQIAAAVELLGAVPVKAGTGLSWGRQAELIKSEKPRSYIGYPVPLLGLARFCGERFSIKSALISGDACPESVLRELDRLFEGRLFPHYGSRETALGGAVTCEAHEGMHLRENHIIAEIVDKDGRVLPDGCRGELVLTTIGLEALPLIRYRTGDSAVILPEPCPCGGVTKRLADISRINSDSSDMEELDSEFFRYPFLVDQRVQRSDNGLCMEARLLPGGSTEKLQHMAGDRFRVSAALSSADDSPFYTGKRRIL